MDERTKEEFRNLIKNMNFRERAVFSLKMREKMVKDGIRKAGCSVWDELTKDLWTRAANGEIDEAAWVVENNKIMEHCKTCRHPMCIEATFGDTAPTVTDD